MKIDSGIVKIWTVKLMASVFGPPVVLHLYTTLFTIILVEKKTSGERKLNKQVSLTLI